MRAFLFDAAIRWRTPNSRRSAPDLGTTALLPEEPVVAGDPASQQTGTFGLADLVGIALGRHDAVQQQREVALNRAYQLLTFITASAMLLVGGVQFLWERLRGAAALAVVIMLLIVLYLTFKAISHCLMAIASREAVGVSPNLLEDGRRVIAGTRAANRVALELLDVLARAHPVNDRARAVSVEHGELAVRTLAAYACMVMLTLATIVIGGFQYATAEPDSSCACEGRGADDHRIQQKSAAQAGRAAETRGAPPTPQASPVRMAPDTSGAQGLNPGEPTAPPAGPAAAPGVSGSQVPRAAGTHSAPRTHE